MTLPADPNLPSKMNWDGTPINDWDFIIKTGYQSSQSGQPVVATDSNGQTWVFRDREHPEKVTRRG